MPAGMFNFNEKPGYSGQTPRVSQGAADSVARSYAALNEAVQQSADAVQRVAIDRYKKEEKLTIDVDQSALNIKQEKILADAISKSSKLFTEEEINEVYKNAYDELARYTEGENEKTKKPNVRIGKHRQIVKEVGLPTFKALFDKHARQRVEEAEIQVNIDTATNNLDKAIRRGNAKLAAVEAENLGRAKNLSPDGIKIKVREAQRNADVGKAYILINEISETDDIELAENLAADLESDLEEGVEFKHLNPKDKTDLLNSARGEVGRVKRRVESAELERYQTDFFENPVEDLPQSAGELDAEYPSLSPAFKARWKSANAGKKKPVSVQGIRDAFELIANAPAEPEEGILLNMQLRSMGFNTSNAGPLFDAWSAKFDPETGGGVSGSYTKQKSISQARIVDVLAAANQRGFWKPKKLSYGEGSKKNPDKDKLSEFNAVLAEELDFYATYTKEQVAKGKSWPEADAAYWDLPKVKKLTDEQDIDGYLERARAAVSPGSAAAEKPDEEPSPEKKEEQDSKVRKPSVEETLRLDYLNNWSK